MQEEKFKLPIILSIFIAVLATISSLSGLFLNRFYKDNLLITSAMRGNDLITLVLAIPLLVWSLLKLKINSLKAFFVWIGILGYMLYNYIFYLYGTVFNSLFLIYAIIVVLSLYALILSVFGLNVEDIKMKFSERTPVRIVSCFIMFIPLSIGIMEVVQALGGMVSGTIPQITVQGNTLNTPIVYATDLVLIMPAMVIAAILLWKRKAWGFILAPMLLIKGITYPFALVTMAFFTHKSLGYIDPLTPLYAVFTLGSLISYYLLIKNVESN